MPITGITDLYGQTASGLTGAGNLATRRNLPGYGPEDDPYGQGSHGQWGDVAGPDYAAPGWNAALRREANLDVYTADFTLTDDTDYDPAGVGAITQQVDQTPFPKTESVRGTYYTGRGQSHGGYHPEVDNFPPAPADGYSSHAGPYPRTFVADGATRPDMGTEVDSQWSDQEARRLVHEVDYGAGRTGWTTLQNLAEPNRRDMYFQSKGETLLERFPEGQIKYTAGADGGAAMGPGAARQHGANSDHVQGGGVDNAYGYGDAHFMGYRQQTDPVPFNYQWLDASERPFIPKGQATNRAVAQTLAGPDSPYGTMGDQTDYHDSVYAPAMVEGPATPYQAPPDPTLGTAGYPDSGDDVFAWG